MLWQMTFLHFNFYCLCFVVHQAYLSLTISQNLLKLVFIESVMLSNHLILCSSLLLCLHSFQASGSLAMSQLFASGGQSTAASVSASVFPINIQVWFHLGLTGFISSQSKGLSRVFSSTMILKLKPSVLSLLYGPNFTSIHDYWENYSLDYMDRCQQSDVFAFKCAI